MTGIITSLAFCTILTATPDDPAIFYRTLVVPLRTWGISGAPIGGPFGLRRAAAPVGAVFATRTCRPTLGGHFSYLQADAPIGGVLPPQQRAGVPVGGRSHAMGEKDARRWSLRFDGQNDYVGFGDIPTGLSALTVEGWFKIGDSIRKSSVLAKDDYAGNRAWYLIISDDEIDFLVANAITTKEAQASWTASPHTWVYLAGVFDGSRPRLYINGVLAASGGIMADPLISPAVAVESGRQGPATPLGEYFDGNIAYLRISSVARYGGTFSPPIAPHAVDGDVIAQWNFTEGAGTTLDNIQGNATYDGCIYGAAWSRDVPPGWG